MLLATPLRFARGMFPANWHQLSSIFSRSTANTAWRGGIKLVGHKQLSNQRPIRTLPLAGQVVAVPLQHGRSLAEPCVRIGQRVLKGEVIGRGGTAIVWAHASTSGTVVAIDACHPADGDQPLPAVHIAADGQERWAPPCFPPHPLTVPALAEFALQMGLVGLGGAGFPTGIKLAGTAHPLDMLLINGAECEPFLTCDDRLMQERAADIVAAASLLAKVYGITQVRIGIEPNKPQAMTALQQALVSTDRRIEVHALPLRYPAGGQPLLVKSLTGRTLAPGRLPAEIGILVLNVATVYALGRALLHGEPLVSRIVTLSGAVTSPGNIEAPIGLPISTLLAAAQPHGTGDIQVGGPMMGRVLANSAAVVSKTTSGLLARSESLFPPRAATRPCIRCNRCVDVCPMALRPLQLLSACEQENRALLQQEKLTACIECGACSQVCPSSLPLRDSFRHAKRTIWLGVRP